MYDIMHDRKTVSFFLKDLIIVNYYNYNPKISNIKCFFQVISPKKILLPTKIIKTLRICMTLCMTKMRFSFFRDTLLRLSLSGFFLPFTLSRTFRITGARRGMKLQ